jgi:alpha-D-ribose 1-methylphosphonate 5-triphosphate synthase subunit PhnG
MPKTETPTDKVLQSPQIASRQGAMRLLALATDKEVSVGLAAIGHIDEPVDLRAPEVGLVMLRGRIGGDGAPFNIGEATVTRCAIQLRSGEIGLSYSLGRDREKARLAAVCDALWQTEKHRATIERHVLAPVRERIERERELVARQVAATRVDFFTLVRGEDQP